MKAKYLGLLSLISAPVWSVPIYLDTMGREWLDVNDSRNRSWIDVAQVCNSATGTCSGILATTTPFSTDIDVDGYTWATRDEVRDLFQEIGGLPADALADYQAVFLAGDGFGAAALSIFSPTIELPVGPDSLRILNGLTRDVSFDPTRGLGVYLGLLTHSTWPEGIDSFWLVSGFPVDAREMSIGVYLYREIPEPSALILMAIGLLMLWLSGYARTHGIPNMWSPRHSSRNPWLP